MYKHVAEAFVLVPHAESVMKNVCSRTRDYCHFIGVTASVKFLDFGDGRAILRPSDDGLHFRVEAQDLVTFYGIRTLLQGHLFVTARVPDGAVEWQTASDRPFGAARGHAGNGRNWPSGK